MIYIGYYFIVNPLKLGVEILIAELGAVGFESFVDRHRLECFYSKK